MRSFLKTVAERALVDPGAARALRLLRGRRLLILAYHNVVDDRETVPGLSAHLGVSDFQRQMDVIARHAHVIPLEELLSGSGGGRKPLVAITFDDGYRGSLELATPVLEERGLPATFFLAPGLMASGPPWWDSLEFEGWERFDTVFRELEASGPQVRAWASGEGIATRDLPRSFAIAPEEEALSLSGHPTITVGSHSWSHPNLVALDPDALREELDRPREWLERRFPNAVPWLAYPYGLNSAEVRSAAVEAGYTGAVSIQGGWVPRPFDRFALPRLNIPSGLSIKGFTLKLSGLFPR